MLLAAPASELTGVQITLFPMPALHPIVFRVADKTEEIHSLNISSLHSKINIHLDISTIFFECQILGTLQGVTNISNQHQ